MSPRGCDEAASTSEGGSATWIQTAPGRDE